MQIYVRLEICDQDHFYFTAIFSINFLARKVYKIFSSE
jgi:hypothetical protein